MLVFFSVLYNPPLNAIINIRNALSIGLRPIVYLNSVDEEIVVNLQNLGIVVLGDNSNVGLGVAFRDVEEYLESEGVKHYIYFDQDTSVSLDTWRFVLDTYLQLYKNNDIGLIFYGKGVSNNSNIVISSGCLFSINIIKLIGYHDRTFFVEGVDYEFCLRLRMFNLRIVGMQSVGIDHDSLQDESFFSFLHSRIRLRIYGNRRLLDFNHAHFRLLHKSLMANQYRMHFFFIKSFIKFNANEFLSRVIRRWL